MEWIMPLLAPDIRDATEADLPRILAIINHAIEHTTAIWSLAPETLDQRHAWLRNRTASGFPVLVAESDGVVLGFASYGVFRPWEGYSHTVEHSVYVHPDTQRRGVGRALLTALIADAQAGDRHAMIGAIEASNEASIALHERAGFAAAGVLREVGRKFGRWHDLLFMQKLLSAPPAPNRG
jgi:phosphinothricin acetyltransferase